MEDDSKEHNENRNKKHSPVEIPVKKGSETA